MELSNIRFVDSFTVEEMYKFGDPTPPEHGELIKIMAITGMLQTSMEDVI